jgi:glycine/serine hydroxymethyltransferase
MTTMGMGEGEAQEVASLIVQALRAGEDEGELAVVEKRVRDLAQTFPPYPTDFSGHV